MSITAIFMVKSLERESTRSMNEVASERDCARDPNTPKPKSKPKMKCVHQININSTLTSTHLKTRKKEPNQELNRKLEYIYSFVTLITMIYSRRASIFLFFRLRTSFVVCILLFIGGVIVVVRCPKKIYSLHRNTS